MKKTLFLLFVVITVSSCGHGGDPIDPVQTYSVRNSCDENILVEYSLSAKFVANYVNKKDSSNLLDTMMTDRINNTIREVIDHYKGNAKIKIEVDFNKSATLPCFPLPSIITLFIS